MSFLLDDVLLAPLKGAVFLARKIEAQAKRELLDEAGVKQQLAELYRLYESGRISDEEFEQREEGLVERLEAIREAGEDVS